VSEAALSVVIPTFGRPEQACAAARSALAQLLDAPFEVIVVDDGGQDGTREAVEALADSRLRYLWIEHAGPAAARNAGARAAAAPIIAFLDSDTVAQAGWLAAGWGHLNAEAGLFGVEGKVQRDAQYPPTPFTEAVENLSGGRWLSCNLFVRKAAFLALGGFDERFTEPCREDSEFAFRARAAGHSLAFVPAALVRHPVREVAPKRQYHHAREGRFEALIERQHPQAYRQSFKWLDGRQVPAFYLAHYAAFFLLPFSWKLGLAALGSGVAATLFAWCRKRRVRVMDPLRLFVPALLAPYLRLFWVIWGYERYPVAPDPQGGRPQGLPVQGQTGYSLSGLLAVVLVLLAYAITRAPFYLQALVGEEGIFAYLLTHATPGPAYCMVGRIGGVVLLEPMRHPAGMYEAYTRLGSILRFFSGERPPSDIWVRLAQSCFQGLLWACVAWRYGKAKGVSLLLLGLLALMALSSPLGMSASIYLQTDSSSGLLLAGLLVFAVLESSSLLGPAAALFALAAVGKQEWSVAVLMGLGLGEIWAWRPGLLKRALILGAALVLGHFYSWTFDPLNYAGGLGVLSSVSPGHQALAAGQGNAWSSLWAARAPFVLSLFTLLLPATLLAALAPPQRRAQERLACALAWTLFLPFFASTWNDSPRYFAPAWGAAFVCLAGQLARRRPAWGGLTLAAGGALAVTFVQVAFLSMVVGRGLSITEFPSVPWRAVVQSEEWQESGIAKGCVPRMTAGYAWARPGDFVLSSMTPEDSAVQAAKMGRTLCPPVRPR
jgi:glycosyltransferase involved in cell wall biosynthesis